MHAPVCGTWVWMSIGQSSVGFNICTSPLKAGSENKNNIVLIRKLHCHEFPKTDLLEFVPNGYVCPAVLIHLG